MELKQYLKIIGKNYKTVLLTAIVVAIVVVVVSWQTPARYKVFLRLLISPTSGERTKDYQYDGYYAIKAADEFGKTVVQWFKNPEMARSIYNQAGIDTSDRSIRKLSKAFQAQQMDPQYIEVRFSAKTEEQAKKISLTISEIIQVKADKVAIASSQSISFSVIAEDPTIIFSQPSILINGLIALVVGLILGIFVVSAKEYLKS